MSAKKGGWFTGTGVWLAFPPVAIVPGGPIPGTGGEPSMPPWMRSGVRWLG